MLWGPEARNITLSIMPPYEIELAIILRTSDDDAHLAEALFFPEVSRYGDDPETLKRALVRNCVRILEAESTKLLFRRTIPPSIEPSNSICGSNHPSGV